MTKFGICRGLAEKSREIGADIKQVIKAKQHHEGIFVSQLGSKIFPVRQQKSPLFQ